MSSVLKKAIKNAKFFLKVCYYSKTPSYDHPVNMTTSLIRPHFFWPQQKPFLVFYGLFYKRNRKHSPPPVFPYVIETPVKVWENSKLRENTRPTCFCCHFNFQFSQTSTRVSITICKHGKCFLFLKYKWV